MNRDTTRILLVAALTVVILAPVGLLWAAGLGQLAGGYIMCSLAAAALGWALSGAFRSK